MSQEQRNALLVILDGWGLSPDPNVSAISQANTPCMDNLYSKYPNTTLVTYGEQVGLPEGQMGNSEVGHLNIGAGRIVYQDLAKINKAIREKSFHNHQVFLDAVNYAKQNDKTVHFIGLLSDGGVHSHINHLKALCEIADTQGVTNTFIHAFMDGRDVDPKSGIDYVTDLTQFLEGKTPQLASIIGRYYAMDRDKRWERVKLAYDLMVNGQGTPTQNPVQAIQDSYDENITDEFIKPIICTDDTGQPLATIKADDVVIFYNFRTDRPREISEALSQKDFPDFNMKKLPLYFVTMTRYDESFENVKVAYPKDNIEKTIGEVISDAGLTQVRIAETEKYPHVTFFFSGGREEAFEGESRILVNSPKVATYDLQPEMSAPEVTDKIVAAINESQPNFICLNYANTDMVGHTGSMEAAVKATETVDGCLDKLVNTALKHQYDIIIIADHGNSDTMLNKDGSPNTAHTTNPVPCIFVSDKASEYNIKDGKLADVAPTILSLLSVEKPAEMNGESLLSKI